MRRPSATVLALSACLSLTALVGCGSSGGSSGSSDDGGGVDAAASVADPGDTGGEDAPAGSGAPAESIPEDGVSFGEAFDGDDPVDPSELQFVLGVLGSDRAGYVSGSTVVVETTADDLEDRQFSCIAVGQFDLDTYRVVVVDENGVDLNC